MKEKVFLFADDVTGACDTGVKLMQLGMEVDVCLDAADNGFALGDADAAAFVSNTRNSSAETAKKITEDLIRLLPAGGEYILYKKIDSMLRGNVGAEIEQMLKKTDYEAVIVCSALPEQGRTIAHGVLTALLADGSVLKMDVAEEIRKTTELPVDILDIGTIQSGKEAVAEAVCGCIRNGCRIIAADAETAADLSGLVQAVQCGRKLLFAGSAGLVAEVCRVYGFSRKIPELPREEDTGDRQPALAVIGSVSPSTVSQLQVLKQEKDVFFSVLDTACSDRSGETDRLKEDCMLSLISCPEGKRILVTKDAYLGRSVDIGKNSTNKQIALLLAETADGVLRRTLVRRLLLSGGETAEYFYRHAGIRKVRLKKEVLPGLVAMEFCFCGRTVTAVTKSGSFGDSRAIADIMEYLAGC